MVDRTFDIITEKGEAIRDVPERLVMDIVSTIMTKDKSSKVTLMDHVHMDIYGNSLPLN